jgi:hypothetical protein
VFPVGRFASAGLGAIRFCHAKCGLRASVAERTPYRDAAALVCDEAGRNYLHQPNALSLLSVRSSQHRLVVHKLHAG